MPEDVRSPIKTGRCLILMLVKENGMKNKVVFIAGPTAGGKSGLALWLAERAQGTVINADSMQVYRELRVITARPSEDDEARVPHRLYGYRPAAEPFSAADWAGDARRAITGALTENRLPIVVGGTGLYLRTLLYGIATVPEIPASVRDQVRHLVRDEGAETSHRLLAQEDPDMAARLPATDGQRIARALEVVRATGRSLLRWQEDAHGTGLDADETLDLVRTVLLLPREQVYARADARLVSMIEDEGALEEIRALDAMALDPALPAMKILGVPEFRSYIRGEIRKSEALTLAQTATRQFAKRQYTWFRNQFSDWIQGDKQYLERFFEKNVSLLDNQG